MRSTLSVASRGARGSSETNIMKTTTHNVDLHYTKEELLTIFDLATREDVDRGKPRQNLRYLSAEIN